MICTMLLKFILGGKKLSVFVNSQHVSFLLWKEPNTFYESEHNRL